MNRTEPSTPRSEDRLDLPEAWRDHLLDRRGRDTPRPVAIDPEAPQRLKALFAAHSGDLEAAIGRLSEPAYEAPIRAGVAGEADPLGAALAARLLARVALKHRSAVEHLARDVWIGLHGIAFACQAAVELMSHGITWHPDWGSQDRARIWEIEPYRIAVTSDNLQLVAPLRSLLAALPDAEYDEARKAIEARRTSATKTFAAAVLMPECEDWVREALPRNRILRHYHSADLVLTLATNAETFRDVLGGIELHGNMERRLALVLDGLGTDALPMLIDALEGEERPSAEARATLLSAVALIPTDEAVAYLLSYLANPAAADALADGVRRFPIRFLRVIASLDPAADPVVRARLAGFVRTSGLLDSLDALSEADREAIGALLRPRHETAAAVPAVFTDVPWAPYAKPAKRAVIELTPPDIDDLRWAPRERESWGEISEYRTYFTRADAWNRHWANVSEPKDHVFNELIAFGPEERARAALSKWDGMTDTLDTSTLQAILARFGEDAAPPVTPLVQRKPKHRAALMPFVNREAARAAAGWLSRSNERPAAKAWLDRHASDAAALLIPDLVGKDAKLSKAALDALQLLDRSVVDARAAEYGEAAVAAVSALLDADPLDPQARIPKLAAWADPRMLPQVLLADRSAALPDAAVRTLMTALAMDKPDRRYAGVDLLAAECDPASLTAFSWGLFELWITAGSPSKDAWAMDQLRRFADDATVRRLTALIREWPGQGQSRKAARGLEVLGGIGSEAALRAVHGLSQKAKFKTLKKTATEQIEVIAERLELTLEQLEDRLVPDFGLAEESLELDYGPRRFTIKFDEALKPYVVDENGKRRASAPKPNAKDDPELAPAAYERFAALRRDLKATAAEQVKRLEAAMAASRSWHAAEFREFLVEHPLMWHLSSRLVWQAGEVSFRLAEDRTLADVEDEPFALPDDAAVRLAHPLTLGDATAAWAEVFADYEILQPFDQLARQVHELSEEELRGGRLARFEGVTVGGGPLLGLLKRGWKFGGPPSRGGYGLYREFAGGGYLYVDSKPGVHPGYGQDNGAEQTLETVELSLPAGEAVDPVAISEVIDAIARLARSA